MSYGSSYSRWRRGAVLLVGLLVALGGGAYELATDRTRATAPAADQQPPATGAPSPDPAAPASPSFDVVRIARDGGAVLAGRAAPGDAVTVTEGGRTIGETRADAAGSWLLTPAEKLPAGAGELGLTARAPDGRMAAAQAPVLVIVPERPAVRPHWAPRPRQSPRVHRPLPQPRARRRRCRRSPSWRRRPPPPACCSRRRRNRADALGARHGGLR